MNKKVFGIDGPGQFPREGLAGLEGMVIGERKDRLGECWLVRWENGHTECVDKVSIKPASQLNGIGVYYKE